MGSITTLTNADGTLRYRAQIRLKRAGKVIHSEASTFSRKALAAEWLRRRESELDQLKARGELVQGTRYTVGQVLSWYRITVGASAQWSRSKEADLKRLEGYDIAKRPAHALSVADYIKHAEARRNEGAGPATIGNDLVWLGQALRSARPSLGIQARLEVLEDARHELFARKMLAKSRQRVRRLSSEEEKALLEHFAARDGRAQIPMVDVMLFALATARRQEEITTLRYVDLDREKRTAWLDDVKHPRHKKGNRREFRLSEAAWAIVDRQPSVGEFVFPYNPKSIGAAFTRACALLGIKDLRFHDLRHEATSRLFEKGYAIQEVAHFTLHDSWATLKRYTHLKPQDVPNR